MKKLIHQIKSDIFNQDSIGIKFKYLGIFKDRGRKKYDDFSKSELIKAGVIDECESVFGSDAYCTYTKQFGDELLNFLKLHVENALSHAGYGEIYNCLYETNKYLDMNDKIEFLKKKYQEIFPQPEEVFGYAIYKGDKDAFTNGVVDWYDWVVNYQFDWYPEIVFLFLTFPYKIENGLHAMDQFGWFMNHVIENKDKVDEDFFEFLKDWAKFYEKDIALKQISDKIKELEEGNFTALNNTIKKTHIKNSSFEGKTKLLIDYDNIELIDLFEDLSRYNLFVKTLQEDEIIDSDFNLLAKENVIDKKLLCAIGYLLDEKGYLKSKRDKYEYYKGKKFIDKILISALNNTFKGVDITTANYSGHKRNTFTLHNKCEEFNLLYFI